MATTIPAKHYVTIQYRADVKDDDGLLGFASPYTKDAAFVKRKATQDSWAYRGNVKVNIDETDDSISCEGLNVRNYMGGVQTNAMFDVGALFMTRCFPIIIDNGLTEGFEVAKSVRRCGWNGAGNVVWRISDPRGFELEISSDNFARVIDCCTIENGKIIGKCVWGRDGAKNILLPEASDVYQEAARLTEKTNVKLSIKDVTPGDDVELLSTKVTKEQQFSKYMGYFHLLCVKEDQTGEGHYSRGDGTFHLNQQQYPRHIFLAKDGTYFSLTTPKVVDIVTHTDTPIDKNIVAQQITDWHNRENSLNDISNFILASPTKLKPSDSILMSLEPITEEIKGAWPVVDKYRHDHIICEHDGKTWLTENIDDRTCGYPYPQIPILLEAEVNLASCLVRVKYQITRGTNSYWHRPQDQYSTIDCRDFDIEKVKKFRMVVQANGIKGKVIRLGYY